MGVRGGGNNLEKRDGDEREDWIDAGLNEGVEIADLRRLTAGLESVL